MKSIIFKLADVVSPSGVVIFSATVKAPSELSIKRSFPTDQGEWRLRYHNPDGTGYIHLHLNVIR
jgi:hypothetical protein